MTEPAGQPALMPVPKRVRLRGGAPLAAACSLRIEQRGIRSDRLERAAARLREAAPGWFTGAAPELPLVVVCTRQSARLPACGYDESYTLSVAGDGISLEAPEEWGVLRGLATLTQLLVGAQSVPALAIDDAPRFPWRGLMLDVARHFLPVADLHRTLAAMAFCKLNVLHLHLSDDQAFRFPSRRYPRLPSARHYTVDELVGLVAAAADLGIRIVPELDVPGHTACWLAAYPEWGSLPAGDVDRFGVHLECIDPTREAVREAVAALLAELTEVFPDHWLHVGGDEVDPTCWSQDAAIRAYMGAHQLADAPALQAHFNAFLVAQVASLGRRALAWDEVLHPTLPGTVAVQAWRGATARDRALAAGHDCIVSAPYYLDLGFPAGVHYRFDPTAPQAELESVEDALLEDPRLTHVAAGLAWTRSWRAGKVEGAALAGSAAVLGAEACLWSELVDARCLDVRLWTRLPALAERFWSPAEVADEADMYRRLDLLLDWLPACAGVDIAADRRRLAAAAGVADAWWPLLEMLEPVKWYARLLGPERLAALAEGRETAAERPYTAVTPLDRVVDGLPTEAPAARRLAALTRAEAGGSGSDGLRELAERWRALPDSAGPAELEPCAVRLRELGELVVAVLDGTTDTATALIRVEAAATPIGEYLLAPVPVLRQWLEARDAP